MSAISIIVSAVIAFGLGDVTDILEDDNVQSALDIAESFDRANRDITEVEEYYIGRSVAATVLDMYIPLEDPSMQQYVNLVGQSVATSSPKPALFGGYHFLVLDSDEVNAIACPGGIVLICRGLTDLAENEDQLAAILAHEVSHVSLRHGISSIDQARWTEFGTLVASEAAERSGSAEIESAAEDYGDLVDDVVSNIITNGYSQETEYQADSLAACICARAGYSPQALVEVLENMSEITSRSGPGFWQTHPDPEDRIEALGDVVTSLPAIQTDPDRTARFQQYTTGTAPASTTTGTTSSTTGTSSGGGVRN